jgi:hypothetical protein
VKIHILGGQAITAVALQARATTRVEEPLEWGIIQAEEPLEWGIIQAEEPLEWGIIQAEEPLAWETTLLAEHLVWGGAGDTQGTLQGLLFNLKSYLVIKRKL